MEKTQVYLRKEELDALRKAAARSGCSIAELVRDAIRKVVLKPQATGPVAILLHGAGAKLHTSIPVVIETFTFLDRNANRDVALTWRESIYKPGTVKILPCELRDLQQSWEYFRHADLYKLSAVDATSFAIMKRARIRLAYTFDHHFAAVGLRFVG